MKTVSVICSGGGTGKTLTAVCLALLDSETTSTALIDADTQDAKSAKSWIDKIPESDTQELSFLKTTVDGIPSAVGSIEGIDSLYIDTAPRIDDSALIAVAGVSDLVVVPGDHAADLEAISQTIETLKHHTDAACLAVLSNVDSRSLNSVASAEQWLIDQGYDVASRPIRRYQTIGYARRDGVSPYRTGVAAQIREDISSLLKNINQRVNHG